MVTLWVILMVKIFKSGGTMNDQLPKCIFTTMITFGVLTAIVSFIDKQIAKKER
jgi:hypothetical protein